MSSTKPWTLAMKLVTLQQMFKTVARGGRLLGMDVGTRNVGLAISDLRCRIASPHSVLHRKHSMTLQNIETLDALVRSKSIVGFTIGYPFEMGGNRSNQELMVKSFVSELEMSGKFNDLHYMYWDERLTSAAVSTMLLSLKIEGPKRKQLIDKMAAVSILQGCLDNLLPREVSSITVASTE